MDVASPIRAVVPSAHGPVLGVLARAHTLLTGRRIADLAEPQVSQTQVAAILAALTEHGLVTRTRAGSSNLYALNRDHLAAPAVELLTTMRERLWEQMTAHVGTWNHRPDGVVVFGSAARGDGSTGSDIDVLVVRPEGIPDSDNAWQDDLTRFARDVTAWTGNPVDLLDRSHGDLATMAKSQESLLQNIRREGRFLVGTRSVVPAPVED